MRLGVRATMLLAAVAALAVPADALVITQLDPDDSWAVATWVEPLTYGDDYVEVDLTKLFKDPFEIPSALVLQFVLEDQDAGKEIRIVHGAGGEEVTNDTGETWIDFHMILVNLPSVLDEYAAAAFTDLGGVSSDVFATVAPSADRLDFYDGTVFSGGVVHFSGVHITHNGVEDAVFYLKEIPTIPEPAVVALLGAGGVVLLARRRRP